MTTFICACEKPTEYRRPSGLLICANCGGAIVAKKVPEVRP